ncbi:hypothetical protein [Engelhardtia mirabilis]|uniref:Uncharacterized protein n=1 Tax=Engelhardtia mirabilis TaxID=2528011 RepID=A0A518BGS2_9BACT|nr:hypothetical protein Pla133_11890 [Planctomycetes bacterium Pla133]QDV00450.1 hypothetical protein Pla86_11890 [Planctomycetes bacterium Pla86]
MEIVNKTKRPLKIPLPGGKKLFLVPGKSGQITPKAAEYPPLVKMVEAGEIEITDGGRSVGGGSGTVGGVSPATKNSSGGTIRHIGDR